jgi:hypothetical protein
VTSWSRTTSTALELELADFPLARRRELVQEISGHIVEARAALESESEADVRNLLDRLGDPADIAAKARGVPVASPSAQPHVARRSSAVDIAALILLLVGGVVLPLVGWLVGVVLLWSLTAGPRTRSCSEHSSFPAACHCRSTSRWVRGTRRVAAGPWAVPFTCTGGPSSAMRAAGIVVVVALFVLPFVTTAFLARRRSRSLALA